LIPVGIAVVALGVVLLWIVEVEKGSVPLIRG
jgi:hypothetical protein